MSSWLTEEQRLLKESVERFTEKEYSFERRHELAVGEDGFSREIWARFAEYGWLAAPLPVEHGGLGGSMVDVAVLMEGFGRSLLLEPYLSTVILGGGLLAAGGDADMRAAHLPAVAAGECFLAFAHVEPQARYNLADVETVAQRDGEGFVLTGRKSVVLHAATADKLIVSARTAGSARDAGGITLFLVDRDAAGLALRSYPTVDGGRAAELTLDAVTVDRNQMIGEMDGALPLIEGVVDRAIVALCAEAVGAMEVALFMTRDYLTTRSQFGVPIGSFQVLQHRVVDMFSACALSRALTYRAADMFDGADAPDRARAASAAKIQIGKAGKLVGQQAVQLHGGMGMTDEMAIGHYFKRLSMIGSLFGDRDHHLRRFAASNRAA